MTFLWHMDPSFSIRARQSELLGQCLLSKINLFLVWINIKVQLTQSSFVKKEGVSLLPSSLCVSTSHHSTPLLQEGLHGRCQAKVYGSVDPDIHAHAWKKKIYYFVYLMFSPIFWELHFRSTVGVFWSFFIEIDNNRGGGVYGIIIIMECLCLPVTHHPRMHTTTFIQFVHQKLRINR